jgi:hypothetical protein
LFTTREKTTIKVLASFATAKSQASTRRPSLARTLKMDRIAKFDPARHRTDREIATNQQGSGPNQGLLGTDLRQNAQSPETLPFH